ALGLTAADILARLEEFSCVPIPRNVETEIRTWIERYGLLRIERAAPEDGSDSDPAASAGGEETWGNARFELCSNTPGALSEVLGHEAVKKLLTLDERGRAWLREEERGSIKHALIKLGYPVDDRGGYLRGDPF